MNCTLAIFKAFMKTFSIIIIAALMVACGSHTTDPRLADIASIVADKPHDALQQLDSIKPAELTEADRHYFDLLSIKARDKAYIDHTSDSLILDVIDYYTSHPGDHNLLYAEALYYGGRVYSDLGDYPTSLRYFQSALDKLPADTPNQRLRGTVHSQTGRLLNTLRLYDRAIPYIEESIRVDSILRDSVGLMYDNRLLGSIYLHQNKLDSAENSFKLSRYYCEKVSSDDVFQINVYLAGVKYYKGENDSALVLIRESIDNVNPVSRPTALAYAAEIYMQANKYDSASIYAKELLKKPSNNSVIGYGIVLSNELISQTPKDSIAKYVAGFKTDVQDLITKNGSQEALIQNSLYNYQLHEREKEKANKDRSILQKIVIISLIIMLLLAILILYMRVKNQKNLLQLQEALINLRDLRNSLNNITIETTDNKERVLEQNNNNKKDNTQKELNEEKESNLKVQNKDSDEVKELSERLKAEFLALQQSCNLNTDIKPSILNSDAYSEIQDYITKERVIPESNPLWTKLELVILATSKEFKYRLQLLTGGKLKSSDYHLALLIKCGITPTQMAILVGRTKGTISYRREALCEKIFGQKLGVRVIDDIIRAL